MHRSHFVLIFLVFSLMTPSAFGRWPWRSSCENRNTYRTSPSHEAFTLKEFFSNLFGGERKRREKKEAEAKEKQRINSGIDRDLKRNMAEKEAKKKREKEELGIRLKKSYEADKRARDCHNKFTLDCY